MAQENTALTTVLVLDLEQAWIAPSSAETSALGLPTVTEPTVCVAAIWALCITLWDLWIEAVALTRSRSVVCCTGIAESYYLLAPICRVTAVRPPSRQVISFGVLFFFDIFEEVGIQRQSGTKIQDVKVGEEFLK